MHILKQIIKCLNDTLSIFIKKPLIFCPLPNQFEVFGVDFLIDTENNIKILEFNGGPDFELYNKNIHLWWLHF